MKKCNLFIFSSKENRVFFAKAVALFSLMAASFFLLTPQFTQNYPAAFLDKLERLKAIQGPKIVLLGSSALNFGVQSPQIEEAFNMPVVNMALQGSMGDAFYEEVARTNITSGDIYLMSYNDFRDDDKNFSALTAWVTLEDHLELWPFLRAEHNGKAVFPLASMLRDLPVYYKRCLRSFIGGTGNRDPGGPYSRNAFNSYGDNIYPRPETVIQSTDIFQYEAVPVIGENKIQRINAFAEDLAQQGATLLLIWYPIAKGEYSPASSEYDSFQTEIKEKLTCDFISDYADYFFAYTEFFDGNMHLTDEGAARYTRQLIKDIKVWQAQQ